MSFCFSDELGLSEIRELYIQYFHTVTYLLSIVILIHGLRSIWVEILFHIGELGHILDSEFGDEISQIPDFQISQAVTDVDVQLFRIQVRYRLRRFL